MDHSSNCKQGLRPTLSDVADLAGRALLGLTFLYWGLRKLVDVTGFGRPDGGGWIDYMAAAGLSPNLLPLVILTEAAGGLCLIAGWRTREAAIALAGFCVLANMVFHTNFSSPVAGHFNWVIFVKNFAVAGGLLAIAGRGAGRFRLARRP